ncbi:MAG: RsmB/NOP family class I SAM-dependent RNA methyltransferase [Butyrivibrio sp.]
MNLPDKYLNSMKELLGDKGFAEYLDSFSKPRLYGLRVNTAKIPVEEFLRISPFKLKPVPWIPDGFYYDEAEKPAKHPYYFAGLYYLQEPSAMTPANVLPVNEGERVLDLCAAPGGKSTELGAKLHGTGLLVSNDVSASRAKALLKNIEVFGIGNVLLTCEYPDKLAAVFGEFFDKILVDAPCSGEGMFRKDSKLIKSWESQGPEYFAPIQRQILDSAYDMLKDGGQMVYSTCTFSRMEDEDNISDFLERHPDMSLQSIYEYEGFTRAFGMEEAVRLFPHRLDGEGHFVALMKKDGILSPDINIQGGRQAKLPDELNAFLDELNMDIDRSLIRISGEKVSLLPAAAGDIRGIRALRHGLLLGEIKKNRFEPSQALAMTINPECYPTVLNLSAEDTNTVRYLKGETIEAESSKLRGDGKNVLVCVDGFPLGWGRLNGLTVKNKYLPGWRWM